MSFLSGVFFSKAFQIVEFLHGLPGSIDDSSAWTAVVEKMTVETGIYAFGMIGGVLLATSEWWWPAASRLVGRMKPQGTQGANEASPVLEPASAVAACGAQIERFKELEPLITRHRDALKPIRDPYRSMLFSSMTDRFAVNADQEELVAELDALRIPHPPAGTDRRVWFNYLVRLEASCQRGDLQEARLLDDPSHSETEGT